MGNAAKFADYGFKCPKKGCPKKHNRRFPTLGGLCKHIIAMHPGYIEKKLNIKKGYRDKKAIVGSRS